MKPLKSVYLVLLVLICVVSVGFASIVLGFNGSDDTLKNRFGNVKWDHELHARKAVSNCQVCHHTSLKSEADPPACSECHTKTDLEAEVFTHDHFKKKPAEKEVPLRHKAFHKSCKGCHIAVGKGPTACRDCHTPVMPADGGATDIDHAGYANHHNMSCQKCHEEDGKAKFIGDEWDDCTSCHKNGYMHMEWSKDKKFDHPGHFAGNLGEVVWDHRQHKHERFALSGKETLCLDCHHMDEELDSQNYRKCSECHKVEESEWEDSPVPAMKHVIHDKCFKCHDSSDSKRPEGIPTACNECHVAGFDNKNNDFGNVIWSHYAHGAVMECSKCHHADKPGEEKSCKECHFEDPITELGNMRGKTHTNCVNCHDLDAKFVTSKNWNDIKTCDACHNPPNGNPVDAANFMKVHNNLSVKNAMHKRCDGCHAEENKTSEPPKENCRICHAFPRERMMALNAPAENMLKEDDEQEEPEELPELPPINKISKEAYEIHRLHADSAGVPCFDCHHNMRPNEAVKKAAANMPKMLDGCKTQNPELDKCLPIMTNPQHCGNCHLNDDIKTPEYKHAKEEMCAKCHEELGVK